MSAGASHDEASEPQPTTGHPEIEAPLPGHLAAGWSRTQIEVVPDRYAMSGYGMSGHRAVFARTGLYARTVVVRDASGRSAIVCCVDLAMVTNAMRQGAVETLSAALGSAFDPETFVLTCTHTHSSPGGCGHEAMYNWVTPGFVPQHLAAVREAITRSTQAALASVAPTTITLHEAAFPPELGVGWNRSLVAHRRNPESLRWRRRQAHRAIDRTMSVLAFRQDGRVEALVSLFGVHATCFGNRVGALDGDNKGRAARRAAPRTRFADRERVRPWPSSPKPPPGTCRPITTGRARAPDAS